MATITYFSQSERENNNENESSKLEDEEVQCLTHLKDPVQEVHQYCFYEATPVIIGDIPEEYGISLKDIILDGQSSPEIDIISEKVPNICGLHLDEVNKLKESTRITSSYEKYTDEALNEIIELSKENPNVSIEYASFEDILNRDSVIPLRIPELPKNHKKPINQSITINYTSLYPNGESEKLKENQEKYTIRNTEREDEDSECDDVLSISSEESFNGFEESETRKNLITNIFKKLVLDLYCEKRINMNTDFNLSGLFSGIIRKENKKYVCSKCSLNHLDNNYCYNCQKYVQTVNTEVSDESPIKKRKLPLKRNAHPKLINGKNKVSNILSCSQCKFVTKNLRRLMLHKKVHSINIRFSKYEQLAENSGKPNKAKNQISKLDERKSKFSKCYIEKIRKERAPDRIRKSRNVINENHRFSLPRRKNSVREEEHSNSSEENFITTVRSKVQEVLLRKKASASTVSRNFDSKATVQTNTSIVSKFRNSVCHSSKVNLRKNAKKYNCESSVNQSKRLKIHGSNRRLYPCKICPYRATKISALYVHLRTHKYVLPRSFSKKLRSRKL